VEYRIGSIASLCEPRDAQSGLDPGIEQAVPDKIFMRPEFKLHVTHSCSRNRGNIPRIRQTTDKAVVVKLDVKLSVIVHLRPKRAYIGTLVKDIST